jgi:hypothetical protein
MATVDLHMDTAEALPADVAILLPEIAYAASEAAFGMIATRLASLGYPVTGDFAPSEVASIEEAFALCVRGMAMNNPDVARLNDPDAPSVWKTDEVYEPSSLRWVEGLTELSVARNPESFAGFSATVRGSRAAIRSFMTNHWGDEVANESLPNWLADIRPDSEGA